jgi:hypothetical protein
VIVPAVPDDRDADLLRALDPDAPAAPDPTVRTGPGGPTVDGPPSDGITVDGLAQRRRTRPRPEPVPPAAPTPAPAPVDVGEDGLPRRVRQANLAAQLRKPAEDPAPEAPARTPEQVRALMSALQTGTARGREAAETSQEGASSPVAWFTDAPPGEGPTPGTSWADAATAGFPFTGTGPFGAGAEASDPADTVVHHGEIVPRRATDPDSAPQPWPTRPSTAAAGGEPTHSEKDA